VQRLLQKLDQDDLQILTSDGLFKGYSFNARERNCLFVNGREGRFIEAGYPLGVDIDFEGRGVAVADLDLDGGLDLVVRSVARKKITYLHNELAARSRFLRVDLVGTRSNRDAVGAVVRITAAGQRQMRVRMAGNGFQAQSESTLHFGLGEADHADELVVRWPSGLEERFENVPAGHLVRIVEGEGRFTSRPFKAPEPAAGPGRKTWRAWTPGGVEWEPRTGRPVIISLWASWCLPCQAEVPVLNRLQDRLGKRVDLVGISFEPDKAAARGFLERNRPRYPVALSDNEALAPLLEAAFPDGTVPLPAFVLLDSERGIARVLTGEGAIDRLEAEAQRLLR
jgi:thiol-disulfide isomerase/thioredoxin